MSKEVEPITVYVVVECSDQGRVSGVFSSMKAATRYASKHSYIAFIILEHVVDAKNTQ